MFVEVCVGVIVFVGVLVGVCVDVCVGVLVGGEVIELEVVSIETLGGIVDGEFGFRR